MSESPIHLMTITELAQRIRAKQLSPVELAQHYLSRIESLQPKLNAFQSVFSERAMDQARVAEMALAAGHDLGPLHGVPYAAKDLFDVKGCPTSVGTHLLEANIAEENATVIESLSRAGMILLGKTHTVQFAYGGVGINHHTGTPCNPWHPKPHVPGGSSSGSGVAVASGLVPVALGTDTGGSVRIPASLCGVTGLKPTFGRISREGVYPLCWSLDTVGGLARSVEDVALLYQCAQGFDFDDDTTWTLQPKDVLPTLKIGLKGLRLAFAESIFWEDADPEVEKAVRESGNVFKALGAHLDSIELAEADEVFQRTFHATILGAEAYTLHRKWVEKHYSELDPIVGSRLIDGQQITASRYLECKWDLKRLRLEVLDSLRDVDAVLVPATVYPAMPLEELDADAETYRRYNLSYIRNTAVGNTLNLCGLSVPCGFTGKGLPVGLMIYGKPYQEDVVLRIGHAYQAATNWHTRTPDLD
jgi:aspartyl-tRNA(Asn)/glutamyl-tRNA(Gln) amidotransferase subunit A